MLFFIWSHFTAGKLLHIMHPHSYIQIFKNADKSHFIKLWTHSRSKPFQAKVQFKPLHISRNQISESHDFEIKREEGAISVPPPPPPLEDHNHISSSLRSWQWGHTDAQTAWHRSVEPKRARRWRVCVLYQLSCSVDPSPSDMHTHTHTKLQWNKNTHKNRIFFFPHPFANSLT